MIFRSRPSFTSLLLLLALLTLQGCATLQSDAESLRARAESYWKARVDGDLTAAFTYEELNARKKQTLQQYVKANAPLFFKANITATKIESPDLATVTLDVEMRPPGLATKKTLANTFTEDWVRVDGSWYHKFMSANPGNFAR